MDKMMTPIQEFTIRYAEEKDVKLILGFITSLAVYEHMEDQVTATEEKLLESIFKQKRAEVIIGEENDVPVCFALFYHNYSTFLGKANLFLEDLFVNEDKRGLGYGKMMLSCLASIAVERNCSRLDWWCLDWNQPSIDFYKSLGASHLKEWNIFRAQHDSLENLSKIIKK
ncbi:MAG: GNAT family N-acetyltransferase [Acholeplasmataceae bacterium]|nr:GNAT family N-acetyltransferase [Acholeplasmataceae bacterium]